jgi:hypothetical protein
MVYLILLWSLLDLTLTICFLNHKNFYELNPIARFLISKGVEDLIFYKIMVTLLVCLAYCHFKNVIKIRNTFICSFVVVVGIWFYFWLKFLLIIGSE